LHRRKNSLFAGSDEGGANWAAVASLVETCKVNGVEPHAYFTDLLTRLVHGWPNARIDELMPWQWAKSAASAPSSRQVQGRGAPLTVESIHILMLAGSRAAGSPPAGS